MKTPWGVFEPKTNCWIGDETGPKLFVDREINGKSISAKMLAKVAATIANEQFDPRPVKDRGKEIFQQFVARPYTGQAAGRRGDLKPKRSTLTALKQLEARAK